MRTQATTDKFQLLLLTNPSFVQCSGGTNCYHILWCRKSVWQCWDKLSEQCLIFHCRRNIFVQSFHDSLFWKSPIDYLFPVFISETLEILNLFKNVWTVMSIFGKLQNRKISCCLTFTDTFEHLIIFQLGFSHKIVVQKEPQSWFLYHITSQSRADINRTSFWIHFKWKTGIYKIPKA